MIANSVTPILSDRDRDWCPYGR